MSAVGRVSFRRLRSWSEAVCKRRNFSFAPRKLSKCLKLTLPTAGIALLSYPILGLANVSADHLRRQYGTFRATDFSNLYLKLDETMGSTSHFSDSASRYRLIFAQFATNNQPISKLKQFILLVLPTVRYRALHT